MFFDFVNCQVLSEVGNNYFILLIFPIWMKRKRNHLTRIVRVR